MLTARCQHARPLPCFGVATANGSSGAIGGEPALRLHQFTKRYDDGLLALDHVDLVVRDGEFFGLLGPNGAGKTTLISAVCNLIRTTSGSARVFGRPHDSLEARLAAQQHREAGPGGGLGIDDDDARHGTNGSSGA